MKCGTNIRSALRTSLRVRGVTTWTSRGGARPSAAQAHLDRGTYGRALKGPHIIALELGDFRKLATRLCRKWSKSFVGQIRIEAVLTDSSSANAWAIPVKEAPNGVYLVVFTRGIVDALSQLGGQEDLNLRAWLASDDLPDTLKSFWGALPTCDRARQVFAAVVVHIAFVMLIHHELAHIGLGHLPIIKAGPGSVRRHENLYRQCYELDADIHAMAWTSAYLVSAFEECAQGSDALTKQIWSAFCHDLSNRRFLIALATVVFYAALGLRPFTPQQLDITDHPPTITRLLLLIHLENILAQKRGEPSGLQIPAIQHGMALLAQREFSLAAEKSMEEGTVNAIGQMSGPEMYSKIMSDSGLEGALDNWEQIGVHLEILARKRRVIEDRMARGVLIRRPQSRIAWY